MPSSVIKFRSGDLLLEGEFYSPEGGPASCAVVVCHPHPQSGGNMHNNVVVAIAESLRAAGIAALSFNFRGVGGSQGSFDDGLGEQDDARAAIEFASALDGVERVGLAGYSFGAGMAAAIADESVMAVALVSAPSGRLSSASKLSEYAGPVLLLTGDQDHVSSVEALEGAAKGRSGTTEVVSVPGVDHFWRGAEAVLEESVADFFSRSLNGTA